eukprot:GFYU01004116.1.p1 GENE.GFYU01004116.1~~GFYU01004116.1.p1  ORF type:complete len:491 (+),score=171.08 GFYU01004116.1:99-1475(+)
MATTEDTGVKQYVIVDSAAIIRGVRMGGTDTELVTIQEVLDEIRDQKARQYLETMPFEMKTRVPSDEAMAAVIEFSKKTGDYTSLSKVDLRVLAMAYQVEKENNGVDHLRKEPMTTLNSIASKISRGQKRPSPWNASRSCTVEVESKPFTQLSTVMSCSVRDLLYKPESEFNTMATQVAAANTQLEQQREAEEYTEMDTGVDDGADHRMTDATATMDAEPAAGGSEEAPQVTKSRFLKDGQLMELSVDQDVDDDGVGWINAGNIEDMDTNVSKLSSDESKRTPVACITGDFAMQNVLMQMGLKLLSPDGLVIRNVKQFILKCEACFKITPDNEKLFCPSCGNNTLYKVSVSVDDQGNVTTQERQRRLNLRGTKYSIPSAKGGRHNNDLILREDELISSHKYKQQQRKKSKASANPFDVDYNPTLGMNMAEKDVTVGYGKHNPNERRPGRKGGRNAKGR